MASFKEKKSKEIGIVSNSEDIIMMNANNGPMLNAYPDSMGGKMEDIVRFLQKPEMKGVFSSFYILPSVFNTDLDRGFSVVDYTLKSCISSF